MTELYYPLKSLRQGHWFKLICGASFQHLPAIRNLVLAYTLAGADCIDVAADPAVIAAAREAIAVAEQFQRFARFVLNRPWAPPWLMVSLNDGEDPHFRKAEFNAEACMVGCSRPCQSICPAQAITFSAVGSALDCVDSTGLLRQQSNYSGVLSDRCYGCGRCLPVCPIQHISTRSYLSTPATIAPLVLQSGVDAVEIHTQIGRLEAFRQLWTAILPWVGQLKLVAVSCADGEGLIDYLWELYDLMKPLPTALVWQTDGRPMSGDIGNGTTRAAIKLGQKVLAAGLPGFVQLAGGTNAHTVPKLRSLHLLKPDREDSRLPTQPQIAGVAYGSYARTLLLPILQELEAIGIAPDPVESNAMKQHSSCFVPEVTASTAIAALSRTSPIQHLEEVPHLLQRAVDLAYTLVAPLKSADDAFFIPEEDDRPFLP